MVDTDRLLAPISEDAPAGSYLKLDRSAYRSLRNVYNSAQSTFRQLIELPESSSDESIVEANQNAWDELRSVTYEALTTSTKDLEILGWYITSQVFTSNPFINLAHAASVLADSVERYWDVLNPDLPDNKIRSGDEAGRAVEKAEFRIKPLLQLVGESRDSSALYMPLQLLEIIEDITFGDYLSAEKNGTILQLKEKAHSLFSGETETTLLSLAGAYQQFDRAEKLIASHCQTIGAKPVSFKFIKANLSDLINAIQYLAGDKFARWPLGSDYSLLPAEETPAAAPEAAPTPPVQTAQTEAVNTPETAAHSPAPVAQAVTEIQAGPALSSTGAITNREHAFHELRRISDYFKQAEPHSPIHFLLERAIRWGHMSLPELMQEMTAGNSNVLTQINQLTGMDNLEKTELSNTPQSAAGIQYTPAVSAAGNTQDAAPSATTSVEATAATSDTTQTETTTTQSSSGLTDFEW